MNCKTQAVFHFIVSRHGHGGSQGGLSPTDLNSQDPALLQGTGGPNKSWYIGFVYIYVCMCVCIHIYMCNS